MESSSLRKRAQACVCVFISIVLTCGLLPVFNSGSVAYAAETPDKTADQVKESTDSVIVVYEDKALDIDEEFEATSNDATSDSTDSDESAPNETSSSVTTSDEATTLEDLGVVEQEELATTTSDYGTVALAQLSDEVSVDEAIEALEEVPGVAYAQPNYSYSLLSATSDPYCVTSKDSSENQQYLFDSKVVDAWDLARSDGSVTVAVLDTGCDLEHGDLAGTVDSDLAYDVTSDKALAQSGVSNGGDSNGHGTLVAGVIAAEANNDEGIAGASYNANILPVKVFNDENVCTSADLIAAYGYLDELINGGAVSNLRVINISLGYYADGEDDADKALHEAIANMRSDHDVLTVCAGGNGSSSGKAKTGTLYPSDFDECFSVTALDEDGANAAFADYNAAKDISAPGVNILSTSNNGGYETSTGSSMAAPLVAGAAALLWAADSSLSSSQVASTLEDTATKVTGNEHAESGSAGALDAQAAVADALDVILDDGAAEDEVTDDGSADKAAASKKDDADSNDKATDNNNKAAANEDNEAAQDNTKDSDEGSATDSDEEFAQEVVDSTDNADNAKDQTENADANSDGQVAFVTDDGETIMLDADDPELSANAENSHMEAGAEESSSSNIMPLEEAYSSWSATWTKSGSTWKSSTFNNSKMTVSDAKYFGVDVYSGDGTINWKKAKAAGVEFAILQCGYGMNETSQDDKQFYNNVKGCLDNNIPFGVYLYSYADSTSRASSEADHVIRLLKAIKSKYGVSASDIAYPIYYDLEEPSVGKTSNRTLLANIAKKFCNKIKDAGYTPGVYASQSWFESYLTHSCFNNWSKWVAQYPLTGKSNAKCAYKGSYDIWQCMSWGKVDGISSKVDINFCYTDKFVKPTVSTTMSSATKVKVSWNKVSSAKKYQIGFKYATGSNTSWKYATTTSRSKTYSGLTKNRLIAVKVRTIKSDGSYGDWSSTKYRYTGKTAGLSTTVNTSKKTIKVKWSKYKAKTGTVSYKIQYRKAGGSWTTKTTSKTSYTIKNRKSNTAYQIRVYPIVKINGSKRTGVCSTTYRYMGKATGLSTSYNASKKKMKVSWSKIKKSGYSVKYKVYYRQSGKSKWTTKTTSKTSYSISMKKGKAYQVRVRPVLTKSGKSYTATYGKVNRLAANTNPSVKRSGNTLKVRMSKVSKASGYQVAYSRSSKFKKSVSGSKKSTSRSVTISNLNMAATSYYVKGRAYKKIKGVTYYTPYSEIKK